MMHSVRIAGLVALVCTTMSMSRFVSAEEDSSRVLPTKWPLVAGVARVRVEVARKHVVVIHDVNLARGSFAEGDVDAFAAFGAPGTPRAVEARLIGIPQGSLEAPAADRGVALPWSYAPRRPGSAWTLLGRATMAGVVVQLPGEAVKRALDPGGMATLRLRALHPLPAPDAEGVQEVLVRLGDVGGVPLVLGRVEVASGEPIVERVEARLCRAGVLGERLAVRLVAVPLAVPVAAASSVRPEAVIAPVLAARQAGEDLCVRFVSRKAQAQKSGSATAAPES